MFVHVLNHQIVLHSNTHITLIVERLLVSMLQQKKNTHKNELFPKRNLLENDMVLVSEQSLITSSHSCQLNSETRCRTLRRPGKSCRVSGCQNVLTRTKNSDRTRTSPDYTY